MTRPSLYVTCLAAGGLWLAAAPARFAAQERAADEPAQSALARLQTRRDREIGTAGREMWNCLRNYAEASLAAGDLDPEFWSAVAGCTPVPLDRPIRLKIHWPPCRLPLPTEYRFWLLPCPGAVLVFGLPAGATNEGNRVYDLVFESLREYDADSADVRALKARRRREAEALGPGRLAYFLFPAYQNASASPGSAAVRVAVDATAVHIDTDGGRVDLSLEEILSREKLEAAFGTPLTLRRDGAPGPAVGPGAPILPLGGPQLYVAVDWTTYLAQSDGRKAWLLARLQEAVAAAPEGSLHKGGVFLVSRGESVFWSLTDLKSGKWPGALPPGHGDATVATLQATAGQVQQPGGRVALVFLTWNPALTMPLDPPPPTAAARALAARAKLTVVQLGGRRLGYFEALAGAENYYDYPAAGAQGPPVRLSEWAEPTVAAGQ